MEKWRAERTRNPSLERIISVLALEPYLMLVALVIGRAVQL